MSVSADVDEQTGREIELPGFEAAVRAGVGSVMIAYNRVNGTWAAESTPLLTRHPAARLGLQGLRHVGLVRHAQHRARRSRPAWRWRCPTGGTTAGSADAVKKGELNEARGQRGRAADPRGDGRGRPAGRSRLRAARCRRSRPAAPAARDIAIAGAVLLKNQGNVLPLGKEDLQSLAVIGPTARQLLVGGGGSANVRPMRTGEPAGRAAAPRRRRRPHRLRQGLRRRWRASPGERAEAERHDQLRSAPTLCRRARRCTWTGTIVAPKTGDYILKVQTSGGRGSLSFAAPLAAARRAGAAGQRGARPAAARGAAAAGRAGAAPGRCGCLAVLPRRRHGPGGRDAGRHRRFPIDIPGFGSAALLPTADGLTQREHADPPGGRRRRPPSRSPRAGPGRAGRCRSGWRG